MGHMGSVKNWLEEIAFPFEYCKSITTNEKSTTATLKTRKYSIYSIQKNRDNKNFAGSVFSRLKFSFFSPPLYTETVELNTRNKSLLDFAVRKHIKSLNMFEDGFNFSYDLLSFDGKVANVNIFAVSTADANEILKTIPYATKPVNSLVPLEYVFTKIFEGTSTNPVISIWVDGPQLLVFATIGKKIFSRGTYLHRGEKSDFTKWMIENKYIQNVVDLMKRQEPNQNISFLVWGRKHKEIKSELKKSLDIEVDSQLENEIFNKIKWKSSLRKNEGNKDNLFSNPSLYGLAFCQKSQSFISDNYSLIYSRFIFSHYALLMSLVFFTLFTGMNLVTHISQKNLESTLLQRIDSLGSGITQIKSRLPNDEALSDTVGDAQFKNILYSELKVENFLGWMTNISPKGSVIDQLEIKLVKEDKKKLKKKFRDKPYMKEYTVDLRLVLNRAYTASVLDIDTFFIKLNEKAKTPTTKFIYRNEDDKLPSALILSFLVDPTNFF